MACFRRRHISLLFSFLLLTLLALAACEGSVQQQTRPTATPTPTMTPGEQLLKKVATKLNTAKTLHGVFNVKLSGGNMNGTLRFELWNEAPDKNRSLVL